MYQSEVVVVVVLGGAFFFLVVANVVMAAMLYHAQNQDKGGRNRRRRREDWEDGEVSTTTMTMPTMERETGGCTVYERRHDVDNGHENQTDRASSNQLTTNEIPDGPDHLTAAIETTHNANTTDNNTTAIANTATSRVLLPPELKSDTGIESDKNYTSNNVQNKQNNVGNSSIRSSGNKNNNKTLFEDIDTGIGIESRTSRQCPIRLVTFPSHTSIDTIADAETDSSRHKTERGGMEPNPPRPDGIADSQMYRQDDLTNTLPKLHVNSNSGSSNNIDEDSTINNYNNNTLTSSQPSVLLPPQQHPNETITNESRPRVLDMCISDDAKRSYILIQDTNNDVYDNNVDDGNNTNIINPTTQKTTALVDAPKLDQSGDKPTTTERILQAPDNSSRFNLRNNPGYTSIQSRMFSSSSSLHGGRTRTRTRTRTTIEISPTTKFTHTRNNNTYTSINKFLRTSNTNTTAPSSISNNAASQSHLATTNITFLYTEALESINNTTRLDPPSKRPSPLYTLSEEDLKAYHDTSIPTIDQLVRDDIREKRTRDYRLDTGSSYLHPHLEAPATTQRSHPTRASSKQTRATAMNKSTEADKNQKKNRNKKPKQNDPTGFHHHRKEEIKNPTRINYDPDSNPNTTGEVIGFHTGVSDRYHSISIPKHSSINLSQSQSQILQSLESKINPPSQPPPQPPPTESYNEYDNTMADQQEIYNQNASLYSTTTDTDSAEHRSHHSRHPHGNWTLNIQQNDTPRSRTSSKALSAKDAESVSSFALSDFDFGGESDVDEVVRGCGNDVTIKGDNPNGNGDDENIKDVQL